jgi:hypothetical protein
MADGSLIGLESEGMTTAHKPSLARSIIKLGTAKPRRQHSVEWSGLGTNVGFGSFFVPCTFGRGAEPRFALIFLVFSNGIAAEELGRMFLLFLV